MMLTRLVMVLTILCLTIACRNEGAPLSESTSKSQQSPATPPLAGVSGSPSTAATSGNSLEVKARTDACALLTSSEIESVQREPLKETKLSGSSDKGFSVSQCFFTLPTFSNSVSLQVTEKGDGRTARDPKEFWGETFHSERKSEEEKDREKGRKGREEEDEEASSPPQKVSGVGDEAFWLGGRVGGALYILKGHRYLRISVGGTGTRNEKIDKSKTLAQKIIPRL